MLNVRSEIWRQSYDETLSKTKYSIKLDFLESAKCYFLSQDQIIWGDIDELTTAENIVKFIMYDDEVDQLSPEEEMYIEMIYDHLKTFRKECLCLNCIRAWLLSIIQDNEDADKVQHHITNMLEGKQDVNQKFLI